MSGFVIPDAEYERLVSYYTRDITALDRAGKYDPISGRDKELEQMTLILLQRLRKNVILLGSAGVGKTALFTGFSQKVNAGAVPRMLQGARLIELDMSMIGAGSQSRAELEGRLIPLIKGAAERNATRQNPPIIYFIDEFHQLMITFKASSYSGIADLLKPYLTAGNLFIVGATTREEFEDYVRVDPALDRRFQKVFLDEPDLHTTLAILRGLKGNFESHYGLTVAPESCARIVKLTDRYIPKRTNPDKSILALDLACAWAVKKGIEGELDQQSIDAAIASEAGVDVQAIR
ncbi:MAG: AAA family ATPase [Bdellovibrionales bacterium]